MEASFNSNSEVKFRQNLMQEKHANHNKKIIYTRKKNKLKASLRYITRSMLLYRKNSFITASI
jgi:hypothetical protein